MKIVKKVFIGLLAVAVLVSGLLVSSFAESPYDYADILKYYDSDYSRLYYSEDFEGAEYVGSVYATAINTLDNKIVVDSDGDTSNKYLSMVSGSANDSSSLGAMSYHLDIIDGRAMLYVRYSVSSDSALVSLYVSDIPTEDSGALATGLVRLDYESGAVYYYDGSAYSVIGNAISENEWYDVAVSYNGNTYGFTVTDSATDAVVASAQGMATPAGTVKSIALGFAMMDDNRGTVINFDNVYVQAGLDERAVSAEKRDELTRAALDKFNVDLASSDVSVETKLEIIEVYETLVGEYSYTTSDTDALADIQGIKDGMLDVFSYLLSLCTDNIDIDAGYEARLAHVTTGKEYADRVRNLITVASSVDTVDLDRLDAYDTEVSDINKNRDDSEAFITYMRSLTSDELASREYSVLNGICTRISTDYPYDVTYPGVKEYHDQRQILDLRLQTLTAQAEAFVRYVTTAADETRDLNVRLDAYDEAGKGYFDNTSFEGVSDAMTTYAGLSELAEIKTVAQRFLSNLNAAEESIYLTAKDEWLRAAEADFDEVNEDYHGIIAAKERCIALREEIDGKFEAAASYILAVNALDGLTGDALVTAVENARELQRTGNIAGVQGVTEANVKLDEIAGRLDYIAAYSAKFIKLVNMIDDNMPLSERFEAIKAAKAAELEASDTVDGVSDAKTKLVSAVVKYNSDIDTVNSAYADVVDAATGISIVSVAASGILRMVISFIRSIFN